VTPAPDPGVPPVARRTTLPDGEPIALRDVGVGDEAVLHGLLERVTGDSRWFRFFSGGADIDAAARLGATTDGVRSLGLLATTLDGREVLGHGMCLPMGEDAAEIAFEVADGHHRRGIGSVLLHDLVAQAAAAGYREVVAEVLAGNRDMLDMLAASGLPQRRSMQDGIWEVRITVPAPPDAPR
jgi:acetyltransferase